MAKSVYRTPYAYFDLVETFPKKGCAVCNLLQRDVQQYIDNMLFEFANEPGLRAVFSAGRGVCIEHGLMLKNNKIGNVIGIARMYQELLDDILCIKDTEDVKTVEPPRLQRFLGTPPKADGASLANQLETREGCIACEQLQAFEQVYIDIFNRYARDERFQTTYRSSQGLCLPHFRQVLRRVESPGDIQTFVNIQRDIWASLRDEVALFLEKQNYEHIGDPIGNEGDSWIRAIMRMAGERSIFGLRRDD